VTGVKIIVRGVEETIDRTCGRCARFAWLKPVPYRDQHGLRAHPGVCEESGSDHYGHVLERGHPACARMEERR